MMFFDVRQGPLMDARSSLETNVNSVSGSVLPYVSLIIPQMSLSAPAALRARLSNLQLPRGQLVQRVARDGARNTNFETVLGACFALPCGHSRSPKLRCLAGDP